jgi:hypothetical protein
MCNNDVALDVLFMEIPTRDGPKVALVILFKLISMAATQSLMCAPGELPWLNTGRDVISRILESAVLAPKPQLPVSLSLHKHRAVQVNLNARPQARPDPQGRSSA